MCVKYTMTDRDLSTSTVTSTWYIVFFKATLAITFTLLPNSMFNFCGAQWAVIGQLRVAWSPHWAVIGWCLLLAVPRLLAAGCHLSSSSAPTHDTDSLRRTPRPRTHSADAAHTINTPVQSGAASYIANHVVQNKFRLLYNGSLSFLVNRNFLLGRQFLSAKWPTKLHVCYIKCFQNFR